MIDVNKPLENPVLKELFSRIGKNQKSDLELQNKILDEITKKIKSKNILENENGYEIFIQNYLNVMVFKMFGINITLYPFNALGKDKNVFKYMLRRIGMHMMKDEYESKIKNSYREISNSMKIYNNKNEENSKNNFKFVYIAKFINFYAGKISDRDRAIC